MSRKNTSKCTNVDDIDDIKNCLNVMCEKIDDLSKSKSEISQILNMVTKLEKIINKKDNEIKALQDRVEDLEQYTRKDNIIISGLKTRHMSYARATSNSATAASMDNAPQEETNALEKHVIFFLNDKLQVDIKPEDISVCHAMRASPRQPDNVIVKFINRKKKIMILKKAKQLKGTNIFLNEHLTKKNSDIFHMSRTLRKEGRISNTWTRDCKVFIRTNGSPEVAKVHLIKNNSD